MLLVSRRILRSWNLKKQQGAPDGDGVARWQEQSTPANSGVWPAGLGSLTVGMASLPACLEHTPPRKVPSAAKQEPVLSAYC